MDLPPRPAGRPFGVVVLAVLAFVSGVILTSVGIVGVVSAMPGGPAAGLAGGIVLGLLGVVSLVFAWGAWLLQPWAWPMGVVLWALALVDAVVRLANGEINTNLVVAPICLVYLYRPDIRSVFRR